MAIVYATTAAQSTGYCVVVACSFFACNFFADVDGGVGCELW